MYASVLTINDIPNEIIANIISMCDTIYYCGRKNVLSAMRVSKKFYFAITRDYNCRNLAVIMNTRTRVCNQIKNIDYTHTVYKPWNIDVTNYVYNKRIKGRNVRIIIEYVLRKDNMRNCLYVVKKEENIHGAKKVQTIIETIIVLSPSLINNYNSITRFYKYPYNNT
jgi:hypothetical protein